MPDEQQRPAVPAVPGTVHTDRPQPHNLAAERAVLGAMLRQPKTCVDMAIELLGSADVFYSHIHREIFQSMVSIHTGDRRSTDVNLVAVAQYLKQRDRLDAIGGELFLAELYQEVATTAHLESWCEIIRNQAILRRMIGVCGEALVKCYQSDREPSEIVEEVENDIFEVRNSASKRDIIPISTGIVETFARLQDIINHKVEVGIPSGLPDLDRLTAGFKPGEMFVLAARPSIGKTSLALNLIRNVALNGVRPRAVAFFSLEMTADQITRRLLCTESGVPESSFHDGTFKPADLPKLTKAADTFRKAKIFIDPTGGLTVAELRAKARRLYYQEKIELVVIDYLQLMTVGGRVEGRQQEVAQISGGIKQLAKDLNIPVLVLAQLNREVEKTASESSRPKLSHLRESGAIEQDADVVAFLHRNRDEAKKESPEIQQYGLKSELIVEKNRNGRTGYINLRFFPSRMEFCSESKFSDEDRPPGGE